MAVGATVTPAEQAARYGRAKQLATGSVRIPLACPTCDSSTLDTEGGEIRCHNGHLIQSEKALTKHRRQRIARFLRTGER